MQDDEKVGDLAVRKRGEGSGQRFIGDRIKTETEAKVKQQLPPNIPVAYTPAFTPHLFASVNLLLGWFYRTPFL